MICKQLTYLLSNCSGVFFCVLSLGAMSLAGAQGNMWAVEGGNKLVCSGLLKMTKANVIHARVMAVSLHSSGTLYIFCFRS